MKQPPIRAQVDRRFLFDSDVFRQATAHLLHALRGSGGLVVLTGDAGTGKTMAVNHFVRSLPQSWSVALASGAFPDALGLLRQVCKLFHVAVPVEPTSVKGFMDALHNFLLQLHAGGRQALLIVDDAHGLSPQMLELMRQLNNLETAERKLLQIVLVGRTELRTALSSPAMAQLAQRVAAFHHMPGLSVQDVGRYVQQRLSTAGTQADIHFKPAALRQLHRLGRGAPRAVHLLAERALKLAQARGLQALSAREIKLAADDVLLLPRRRHRQRFQRWAWAGLCLALLMGGVALALKPWLTIVLPT